MCLKLDPVYVELYSLMNHTTGWKKVAAHRLLNQTELVLYVHLGTKEGVIEVQRPCPHRAAGEDPVSTRLFITTSPVELWDRWKKWTS